MTASQAQRRRVAYSQGVPPLHIPGRSYPACTLQVQRRHLDRARKELQTGRRGRSLHPARSATG